MPKTFGLSSAAAMFAVILAGCGGESTGPVNKALALVVAVTPQKDTVFPGDSLTIDIIASGPSSPLSYTLVRVHGTTEVLDSVDAKRADIVRRSVVVNVPSDADFESSLDISVTTADVSGRVVTKTLPGISVFDLGARPLVRGSLSTKHGGGAESGDTLTMMVVASDRSRLTYLGYRFGAPANVADSVPSTRAVDTLLARITVPSNWSGASPYTIFARDSAGNTTNVGLGVLTVAARVRHPISSVALPGQLFDAVFDEKRNLIYMSVPDLHEVAVLSLETMTFLPPLSFDAMPRGLDLTTGGDTLVVALLQDEKVALIDLLSATTTTIAMPASAEPNYLRVSGRDKILVATEGGSGFGGALIEADPVTGRVVNLSNVTSETPLAVAGNRSSVVAAISNSCCPETVLIYDSALRLITERGGTADFDANTVTADYAGDRFLLHHNVFSSGFTLVAAYTGPFDEAPSVLSSDGMSAYFGNETDVIHARLDDSGVIETFPIGEHPQQMWMSPDGLTMLVTGGAHLFILDLW